MKQWVSIEGAIATGKSKFLEHVVPLLFEGQTYVIVPEPVETWVKEGVLELSYTNRDTWTFPAQCFYFTSRIKVFREKFVPSADVTISERSPFSDTFFCRINLTDQKMYRIYADMWRCWQDLMPIRRPTLFLYLKAPLDTCMERVHSRGRPSELTVSSEYQQRLIEQHDSILLDPAGVLMPDGSRVPCIVVDTSRDYVNNPEVARQIAEELRALMG
jgi:deoxycitidine kinase